MCVFGILAVCIYIVGCNNPDFFFYFHIIINEWPIKQITCKTNTKNNDRTKEKHYILTLVYSDSDDDGSVY